jgi:hypothetical protein
MSSRHPRGPRRSRPAGNDSAAGGDYVRDVLNAAFEGLSKWVCVTCPACGVVRVRANCVVVRNCTDDQTWSYRAMCSNCDTVFVAATPSVLALPAIAAGLPVELWTRPTLSARHEGSPIHAVDALELHLALLEPDWFEQLERVVPRGDR